MSEKYDKIQQRYAELEKLLADPQVIGDQAQYQKCAKEYSDLQPQVALIQKIREAQHQIGDLQKMSDEDDPELKDMARLELDQWQQKLSGLEDEFKELTRPAGSNSNKDLIIEIRAGTGGQEASLFAADLHRMYVRYAEQKGWKVDPISSHPSETGGFKEVIFSVSGRGAEKHLKWESGGHRVQRVPSTEASGRIHTSAATVAVLLEPEEVDVQIEAKDLKIDVYRSSGPGGQSVNTTDSAIRITHLPTGVIVTCQDERSQLKNRAKAMRVLRARLMEKFQTENNEREMRDRKLKIGSGDRSEKIRTYNFPDRRVTDHRIGFTSYRLQAILDGDLDEMTEALIKAEEEDLMV